MARVHTSSPVEHAALQISMGSRVPRSREYLIAQELEVIGLAQEGSVVGRQGVDHGEQRDAGTIL
jgi:hypothetical protein